MTAPTKPDLVALAYYFDDIEVDENGMCKWTDVANAQTHLRAELNHLASQPSLYEAGLRDEIGWLIEQADPPVYYTIHQNDYDEHWTHDAAKALRFARREDAQAYVDHIGWTSPPVRVIEHLWPALPADGGTAQSQPFDVMMTIDPDFAESFERNENFESQQHCEQPSDTRTPSTAGSVREALEFYADRKRYQGPNQRPIENDPYAKPDDAYLRDVARDGGEIARSALALSAPVEAPVAAKPEYLALADQYDAGTEKCRASGYEEFGDKFFRERKMVSDALRAYATPRPLPSVDEGDRLARKLSEYFYVADGQSDAEWDAGMLDWHKDAYRKGATAILTLLGGSAR